MNKKMLGSLLIALCGLAVGSIAQSGPLPIGSVTDVTASTNCAASGWISGSCNHAIVTCETDNGVQSIGITYDYETPPGSVGTIVFFSCCDGTSPTGTVDTDTNSRNIAQFAADYYNDGYQVVQTAWDFEWEDPTSPSTDTGGNIGYAACRPATFLNYVRHGSGSYPALWTTGGMCVQAESAGGGGAAYAMSWYGEGTDIDKISLLSAPPLSDIEQGCRVTPADNPVPSTVTVCPAGQLGCNSTNSPSSWIQAIRYTDAALAVQDWTGRTSCAGTSITSGADNSYWKSMSIVDGSIGTFNYPSTNMTAWLCSSVNTSTCTKDCAMNNSSPEAQLFFSQFTSTSQYQGLTINGVGSCGNAEEVGAGDPPSNYIGLVFNKQGQKVQYGWQAVEYDMTQDPVNSCISHHGH